MHAHMTRSCTDCKNPLGGVGHCFAWHVRVSLSFKFKFETEKLPMHLGITGYLVLPELKY